MQGFNMGRYVPPDLEGTISGNALNKKHALGARASKLKSDGILTVRFEMPFGVWCSHCPKPTIIGQGVRFNAEKKKVGAYHTTPIFSFRMRHTECGGLIEIRTDPANAEYVVHEGGTRRDTGDDQDDSLVTTRHLLAAGGIGGLGIGGAGEIQTAKEQATLRADAFARLEKTIEDRGVLIERSHRIAELEDASRTSWEDPYAQNRRLRAAFRVGRKSREKDAKSTEDLRDRLSLGIDLLPATEEDARRAKLVDFGVADALEGRSTDREKDESGDLEEDNGERERRAKMNDAALSKPLFAQSTGSGRSSPARTSTDAARMSGDGKKQKRLKAEIKASQTRESLASTVTRNTRVSHDPFLFPSSASISASASELAAKSNRIQGIKRKRVGLDREGRVRGHRHRENAFILNNTSVRGKGGYGFG
ncbi:CWC16 protein [Astrocystis sublimbata]|nr:CWC16 protein [Astrocystis sublimbata]